MSFDRGGEYKTWSSTLIIQMITKIIAEAEIQKAKKQLEAVDRIVIVTHVSPDGDAIGSSLGLYHFLLEQDKQVNIIVPNDFPEFLKWMKGANDILIYERNREIANETIAAAELIFCLDFNTLKRIEEMSEPVRNAGAKKIMIDHHPYPEKFGDVTISYPQISSTAEMIFRFICRMGYFEDINLYCAENIFTGMMTDTNAFTVNSNSPEIYYIIGELLKKGVNKDLIYSRIYNNDSEDRLRLKGYVLYKKMKIYPEYKTALIALSKEEQEHFHYKKGDTEGFVNLPLEMKNIIFSVFFRDDKDQIKISFRSQGEFPCNQFAAEHFNGGGHLNAAGGEFLGSLEEAVTLFEKALPGYKSLLLK